jgi:sulfur carrier protein ThiS
VVQVAQETSMLAALQQVELVSALVAVAVEQDFLL